VIRTWFQRLFYPRPSMTYAQIVDRIERMTPQDEEWNMRGSDVAHKWGVSVDLYARVAMDCARDRTERRRREKYTEEERAELLRWEIECRSS
jgi:hypothetical protein